MVSVYRLSFIVQGSIDRVQGSGYRVKGNDLGLMCRGDGLKD